MNSTAEIKNYENILKNIGCEYNNSTILDRAKIREKEVYCIRQIHRLKKLQNEYENIRKTNSNNIPEAYNKDNSTKTNSKIPKEKAICKEIQGEINNKLSLQSHEKVNTYENITSPKNILLNDSRYGAIEYGDIIGPSNGNNISGLKSEIENQPGCEHDWIRGKGDYNIKCAFCIYYPSQDNRATCRICYMQTCCECLKLRNQNWRAEEETESYDKILNSRVRNLENRLNKLEEDLEYLKGIADSVDQKNKKPILDNIELKDQTVTIRNKGGDKLIQLKDTITSFGNKYIVKFPFKDILGIRIPMKIVLKPNISYKLLALLDTGCTKNIMHDKFFAKCPELVTTIDNDKADISTDMSGMKKIHNQLAYNIESYINGTKYIIDEVTIRDLSPIKDDMIIGLRFLQYSISALIITDQGVTFIPYHDNVPFISEVQKFKSQSINIEEVKFENSPNQEVDEKIELSDNIDHYYIDNTYIECIGLQAFAPNWYRDIKSKKDIERIVQRLEDIQIIGEIPMKHWDKNSIVCKINIINPDYIVKTAPIEATPKDIEEFKMHIEELLKIGAIRESRSPHRSTAFIVRNHNEIARGKSRMVISLYFWC